jgi:hypothetical protein
MALAAAAVPCGEAERIAFAMCRSPPGVSDVGSELRRWKGSRFRRRPPVVPSAQSGGGTSTRLDRPASARAQRTITAPGYFDVECRAGTVAPRPHGGLVPGGLMTIPLAGRELWNRLEHPARVH